MRSKNCQFKSYYYQVGNVGPPSKALKPELLKMVFLVIVIIVSPLI